MSFSVGFVYVLSNPSMPGLVKIGRTSGLSEDRASDLQGTGVPLPFEVEHRRITSNPIEVERRAHELLSHQRLSIRREFFSVDPAHAADIVEEACSENDGIEFWESDRLISLDAGDSLALTLRRHQIIIPLAYSPVGGWEPADVWQVHSDGDLLEIMVRDSATHMAGLGDDAADGTTDPIPHLDRVRDVPNWPINGREYLRPGHRLLWLDEQSAGSRCLTALFESTAHCQVTCRTRTLRYRLDGLPLILNDLTTQPSPKAVSATHAALQMGPPRQLEDPGLRAGESYGQENRQATPEYWLPQLAKRLPKSRGQRHS